MKAHLMVFLLPVIVTGGWPVRAQQQPVTGSIYGTVVHAVSNGPLSRVRVTAESPNRNPIMTTTDSAGAFAFLGLVPGAYQLTFAARGYVPQTYGQKGPGGAGTSVEIVAGKNVSRLVARLTPFGSVEGRVHDSNGNPATDAPVQLMSSSYDAQGKRTFSSVSTVYTDDRGMYRIFWITPGRYYLRAGGRPHTILPDPTGGLDPFAQTYYPNGVSPEFAVPIDVPAGADLHGMDFLLQRQRLFRIRGHVVDVETGRFPPDADIGIKVDGSSLSGGNRYNKADGSFEIPDLLPGSYRIIAMLRELGAQTTVGGRRPMPASDFLAIQIVDKDVADVVLRLFPPVPVTGRVVFDDNGGPPQGLTVRLEAVERGMLLPGSNTLVGIVNPDGAFKIPQIVQGDFVVRVSDPGSYVKESRYGGSDVLNNPLRLAMGDSPPLLEIKLSRNLAEVSGRITDGTLQAAAGARVVLVPDRARHRSELFKQATTDAGGNYKFTNVWPGDYKLFAWESIETNSWYDPEIRRDFERDARPVRVRESGRETVDARLIPAKPL